jgi:hypothetical protein
VNAGAVEPGATVVLVTVVLVVTVQETVVDGGALVPGTGGSAVTAATMKRPSSTAPVAVGCTPSTNQASRPAV